VPNSCILFIVDHEPRKKWVAFIPNDVPKCHLESIFRAKQSIACYILIKDKQSQKNYKSFMERNNPTNTLHKHFWWSTTCSCILYRWS
jgi:hypothetical protein